MNNSQPNDLDEQEDGTVSDNRGGVISKVQRIIYLLLGFLMLALGIIGAFLPVMPTTIFIILAAWFFGRSSPAFEARLLAHPQFGPLLIKWREKGAVPVKAKFFACGGMAMGYAIFWWGAQPGRWLAIGVALFMLASALYVVSRPSE
ncbi:YbaN family protein [Brucellaceae bacterium C25G]